MKLKKLFDKILSKKIFFSFIISYLIIAIIPFSALLYSYFTAQSNLKQQVSHSIDENLNTCLSSFDTSLTNLNEISAGIGKSADFQSVISEVISSDNNYDQIRLSEMLRDEVAGLCDYAYIYIPQKDLFISPKTNCNFEEFSDMFYTFSSDEQKQLFKKTLSSNSYSVHITTKDLSGKKYIDFIYSYPLFDINGIVNYSIGYRLSEDYITNIISNHTSTDDKNIYLIDKNNNIVYSKQSFVQKTIPDYTTKAENSFESRGNDTFFYKTVPANNWMMLTIVPDSVITKSISHIRYVTMLIMILCLFLSVFLTKIFITTNYKPIKMMLSAIGNTDASESDYEAIEKALSNYKGQKQSMQQLKIDKEKLEYNRFMSALLLGNTEKYSPVEKYFEKYNIKFDSDLFAVISFFIKNPEKLFNDDTNNNDIYKNMETISFIIKNVFEEMIGECMKGYVFENNGLICCIVNIPKDMIDSWENKISDIAHKANLFISSNFNFSYVAGISNIHNKISDLDAAFSEATSIFDYHSKLISTSSITYSSTRENNSGGDLKQLENAISSGDFELSKVITEKLLNTANGNEDSLRLIKTKIMFSILNKLHSNNISDTNLINGIFEKSQLIMNNNDNSFNDVTQALELACDIFAQSNSKDKSSSTSKIVNMIKEYIDLNFTNSELNVSMVGHHFDMSPYYLSSIFKKVEGISILEYISKVRITSSLEYLENGETLSQIAEKVGFSSSHTYIRNFGSIMNCTPKQYLSKQ